MTFEMTVHDGELGINDDPYTFYIDGKEVENYDEFAQSQGFEDADAAAEHFDANRTYEIADTNRP